MRVALLVLSLSVSAQPAAAQARFLSFDPADRVTTALTRGVTLEVERGLFGAVRVNRIISTSARGSAEITRGGPDGARAALSGEAASGAVYSIVAQGDGRGLSRALCPAAEATYLVVGRVRAGHPLSIQAVGRWPDGGFRPCAALTYSYRGEWAVPAGPREATPVPLPAGPR